MEVGMDSSLIRLGFQDKIVLDPRILFCTILFICVVICSMVEEINKHITAVFIGLSAGTILLVATNGRTSKFFDFDENFLFTYLLPPISFIAGFRLKEGNFFKNFTTITLFGAGGTLISFCVISFGAKMLFEMLDIGYLELRDYLAIGAIFSAIDSVSSLHVLNQDTSSLLYNIVFVEGIISDVTSVALFSTIHTYDLSHINSRIFIASFLYLFLASALLGVLFGLLSIYIIKKLARKSTSSLHDRESDREVALVNVMACFSYMAAEIYDLSGILTVFFCGVFTSHYTWYNLKKRSRDSLKIFFPEVSYCAEIFIFLYVGMDLLDMEKWNVVGKSPIKTIVASSLLFCLVVIGRASFILVLSYLSNSAKKSESDKLNLKQQITIWRAGLMRGTFSMVLAYNQFASRTQQQPGNVTIMTYTITIVLVTKAVLGLLIKPLSSKPFAAPLDKKGE